MSDMSTQDVLVAESAICFYPELSTADGLVIPLGHIAEIKIRNIRGLGMIARTELTKFEWEHLGTLGQRLLTEDPFYCLSGMFDEAWDAWSGRNSQDPLAYLAERYGFSLNFAAPGVLEVPNELVATAQPLRADIRSHLWGVLDEAIVGLVPAGPKSWSESQRPVPSNELWELAA